VAPALQAQVTYALKDLGGLFQGGASYGQGINDSGQVVGYAQTSGGQLDAFLSGPNGAGLSDLSTLSGGNASDGFGVNSLGQVAGYSTTSDSPAHAILSGPNGGPLNDLGTLSGGNYSQAYAVNASGQVAGYSLIPATSQVPAQSHAFLSGPNGGPLNDLGTFTGATFCFGIGVNDSGQVAGYSNPGGGPRRSFLSGPNGGALTLMGTLLGGTFSQAQGINASGQVVGFADTATGQTHAFLSGPNGGDLIDLDTLSGFTASHGRGVNANGWVVGDATVGALSHAFLYIPTGGMLDLNNLIDPASGFVLTNATAINDSGQITGFGTNRMQQTDAFLLTPVPEVGIFWMTGCLAAICLIFPSTTRARRRH
jgi:probable HAF family extracellular repeat protein